MIKTGFKSLDNLIDLNKAGVTVLTGIGFANMLSGDIANNICLGQEYDVLEVVSPKKEYLIKRLFVNNAGVNYKKWAVKDQYTKQELQQIGQATVDLIEVTKRLPTIIEQELDLYNLGNVAKLVDKWANCYADSEDIMTLVVLDLFPLNKEMKCKEEKRYTRESVKLIKRLNQISQKLNCPIIIVAGIDLKKQYNNKFKCLTPKELDNIDKINKYVNNYIVLNYTNENGIFNLDIYNNKEKTGTCKLRYNYDIRKFEEVKNGFYAK